MELETIILNAKQQEAVDKIYDFLDSEDREFLLTGRAGTGKTTTISFIEFPYTTIGMAISHKAKEVLRQSLPQYDVVTVAGAIGLEKVDDLDTGKTEFLSFGKEINRSKLIFIVDECSMIDSFSRSELLRLYPKAKFIYLGDTHQLPPIKDKNSNVFSDEHIDSIELLDNMRTGVESPIMTLLNNIVKLQVDQCNDINLIRSILPTEDVHVDNKRLVKNMRIGEFYELTNEIIIITYHNYKKDILNNQFRDKILGFKDMYNVGDKLIFNNNIYKSIQGKQTRVFTNSEIVTVKTISNATYRFNEKVIFAKDNELMYDTIEFSMPYYLIAVEEKHDMIYVPSDITKFSKLLDKLSTYAKSLTDYKQERAKMWRIFFMAKYAFYDVSYAYALTSHKSQGSTYDSVTVDFNDVFKSKMSMDEKLKCFYVACSRAKNNLNIIY